MGRRGKLAAGIGGLAALLIVGLFLLWRWLLNEPEQYRTLYMQTAAVVLPGLSAVAALGSVAAAWAAWASAKSSADTAKRAQEALARHFRPGGGWGVWSKEDDLTNAPGGLTASKLGNRVMADFQHLYRVNDLQFWYTTEAGENGPIHVPPTGGLVELPGVVGVPRSEEARKYGWKAQTNITTWRARCFEPNAGATWEAVHVPNPHRHPGTATGGSLDFELVRPAAPI